MRLTCISIGKVKDSPQQKLCDDYSKRLSHYARFEERCLKPVKGKFDADELRQRESKMLLEAVPPNTVLIVLDERGETPDSQKFAEQMRRHLASGRDLTFLIGGAYGHSDEVRESADQLLALSSLTLPHELARVVLYEQLYRAMTLVRGEPYHK